MGGADRMIRIIIAAIVGILYYMGLLSGTVALGLIALSAIFVLTSLFSICPMYTIFGLNTCSTKK